MICSFLALIFHDPRSVRSLRCLGILALLPWYDARDETPLPSTLACQRPDLAKSYNVGQLPRTQSKQRSASNLKTWNKNWIPANTSPISNITSEALLSRTYAYASSTEPRKSLCKTYLSRTQAELGRSGKQQQEQNSPNHVQRLFLSSVCPSQLVPYKW